MRKSFSIGFLVILSLFLFGCNAAEEAVPSDAAVAEISIDDFSVPQGYTLVEKTTSELSIVKDGQVIGGITNTGLDASAIDEEGHKSACIYLESLGPVPLICEYIVMNGGNFLSVTLAITDPETEVRTETSRRMFAHDGMLYDVWVDWALVTEDEKSEIFKSILVDQ